MTKPTETSAVAEQEAAAEVSRRNFLARAGTLPLAALCAQGLGGIAALPALAAGRVGGHVPALVPSPDILHGWLTQLHGFGPIRFTGTPHARAFEEFLAKSFGDLGCTIERDQFRLTSYDCANENCSIVVKEASGAQRTLDVLSFYPFSASTKGKPAVNGPVLFAGTGDACVPDFIAKTPAAQLAEAIVVIDMPLAGRGSDASVKFYADSFPNPLPPLAVSPSPATDAFAALPSMAALEKKCRAIIFCRTDISNEAARYTFLPFTDQFRLIPSLWVGAEDSNYLKSVSGNAMATVRLDATLTPDARADTILATPKGDSDQVVLMTTQTDGPNECNENGALGLLACASYLSKLPKRRRTFVFSLPTGHYAPGPVRDPVSGSGRPAGTTGMMARWPGVIKRTVAQISLEQMGAMEWADVDGKWQATGRPAQEHWIPTPDSAAVINRMFMAGTKGESAKYSRSDLVQSGFPGGEGGALRKAGIPGIGLMGAPFYFFRADPKGVIDKLNPLVMHNQVSMMTKMLTLMDRLTPEQLKGSAPISDADLIA